jgi:hypothetical protein
MATRSEGLGARVSLIISNTFQSDTSGGVWTQDP